MAVRTETAPVQVQMGRPRNTVRCEGQNSYRDTKFRRFAQESPTDIELVEGWLKEAEDYERRLALRQHQVRKLILNLKVCRQAHNDLNSALWKGAA